MPSKPTGGKVGRPKGAVSKLHDEIRRKAAQTGILPVDYMLDILRSAVKKTEVIRKGKKKITRTFYVDMYGQEITSDRRDTMALAAAPYFHARLTSITHKGDPTNPLRVIHEGMSPQEAAQAYAATIRGTQEILPPARPPMRLISNG